MESPRPHQGSFGQGLLAGLAVACVLLQGTFAVTFASMASMYEDLGSVQLPALTRVVLSAPWQYGAPLAGIVMIAGLVWRRPARTGPYVATLLLVFVLAVATLVLSEAPLFALAGNIRAEPAPMSLEPIR